MASHARRSSFGLVALIVAVTVVPLSVLLWLGFEVVKQDRSIADQRANGDLGDAADAVVAALQTAIVTTERQVASGTAEWPRGVVVVTLGGDRVLASPEGAIAFYPQAAPLKETSDSTFADVDVAENLDRDFNEAEMRLTELTTDSDPAIRSVASFKLGSLQRKRGHPADALKSFAALVNNSDVGVEGIPVSLLARWSRCVVFEASGDRTSLARETGQLWADLQAGRWQLTQPTYQLYANDARAWTNTQPGQPSDAELLAAAVEKLWADRSSWTIGREQMSVADRKLTVLRVKANGYPRALVATDQYARQQWWSGVEAIAKKREVIVDIAQPTTARAGAEIRTAAVTRLPWDVGISLDPKVTRDEDFRAKRSLLLAGLAVLIVMVLLAAYVIVRAVNREVAVARLQSDFVAAVSHEFRTPLTALRQFTTMLSDGTAVADETRRICYDAQSRATDRLTRLVESVLDFGRMEAGARPYRFEVHDCAEIVGGVVEDFRRESRAQGHRIDFLPADATRIEVDREALSRAVWNLLDNAIKYSPGRDQIEVALARRPDGVSIAVRDYGIGVPPKERQAIFDRFARGGEAQTLGIKGTGIGLSMVDHIVRAHRGRIELESEVGKGSTFTLILPARS